MKQSYLYPALKRAASVLLMLCAFSLAYAQEPQQHVVSPVTSSAAPVTSEEMNKRIEDSAIEYSDYAPVSRIGFFDIAYPASAQEYSELKGYAVLLVVSLTQDQTELPVKRAYARINGKELDLKLIKSVLSKQNDPEKQSAKTFGQYRWDALYLLPAYLSLEKAELLIDFARNRDGFKLGTLSDPPLADHIRFEKPAAETPPEAALERIIRREYPGFLKD